MKSFLGNFYRHLATFFFFTLDISYNRADCQKEKNPLFPSFLGNDESFFISSAKINLHIFANTGYSQIIGPSFGELFFSHSEDGIIILLQANKIDPIIWQIVSQGIKSVCGKLVASIDCVCLINSERAFISKQTR